MLDGMDVAAEKTEDRISNSSPKSRSEIAFPYTHLEDTLPVVRILADSGIDLSRDQLAAVMGITTLASGFTVRIGSARIFQLIRAQSGKLILTDLGRKILSSSEFEAANARREAFLSVGLYRKTWEDFKGRNLPERPLGIEALFVNYGVAPKQKDKARLAFERSAQFAGFFHAGRDKLVEPIIGSFSSKSGQIFEPVLAENVMEAPIADTLPAAAQQLLIKGLLERLPDPANVWSVNERARWLRTLATNLAMIYGENEEPEIDIKVMSKAAKLISKIEQQTPAKPAHSTDLDEEIPF